MGSQRQKSSFNPSAMPTPTLRTLALAALFLSIAPLAVFAAPANTIRELATALETCMRIGGAPEGSEITVVFSLKRDGNLLGKPRISYARLAGDSAAQRGFVAAVAAALGRCFPVGITDGLGGAVAGRPISIRIAIRPKQTET